MQHKKELNSDILQPIPLEEWSLLQELLKDDWPKYSHYYYWIENSKKWKKQDPELAIEIYCPQGKYKEDVTFVAISSFSIWNSIFFTKELSGKRLYEALLQTNRFEWNKEVIFRAINEFVKPIFFSAMDVLKTNQGIETNIIKPTHFYIRSADECANLRITVPKECYLGELNLSHISIIHPIWQNADKEVPEKSMKLLQAMIMFNKSIGLFLKEGNLLVSWALQDDWHGLGVVQTLDSYKKRGYAKIVVNALAKRIGEEGIPTILSVVCGNTPAENMFTSLNWKPTIPGTWVSMKKHPPNTN